VKQRKKIVLLTRISNEPLDLENRCAIIKDLSWDYEDPSIAPISFFLHKAKKIASTEGTIEPISKALKYYRPYRLDWALLIQEKVKY